MLVSCVSDDRMAFGDDWLGRGFAAALIDVIVDSYWTFGILED